MRLYYLLILFLGQSCGHRDAGASNPKIVNGRASINPRIRSTVVSLSLDSKVYCSGIQISSSEVLTAKHCVKDGFTISWFDGFSTTPMSIRSHPEQDIAVVTIDHKTNPISPLEIAEPRVGDQVIIAGYGITNFFGPRAPLLRETEATIHRIVDGMIIYKGNGGACRGDSGGPLFTRDLRLLGVVKGAIMGDLGSLLCHPKSGGRITKIPKNFLRY